MNDNWMNQLRNLADGHEQTPPEGLLDDVKREMSARGLMPASATRRAATVPLWRRRWVAAAAAALLLAGVGTVGYLQTGRRDAPMAQTSTPLIPAKTAPQTSPAAEEPATPTGAAPASAPSAIGRLVAVAQHLGQRLGLTPEASATSAETPWIAMAAPTDAPAVASAPLATPTEAPTAQAAEARQEPKRTEPTRQTYSAANYSAPTPRHASTRGSRLDFGAYYGAQPSQRAQMDESLPAEAYNSYSLTQSDPLLRNIGPLAMAALPPVTTENHHRPLRMGVSVRYRLSPRWSLMTGVNYSRLTSEFTEEGSAYMQSTTQKLHYIGIPVSASYDVWQSRHVRVYAKAGGEVEKLVKGRATVQTTYGAPRPAYTENVSEHRPVFSTHAAAGVEYQPASVVSVFVEPGASYHFNNGSGVRSAYTARPLDFTLSVGLRLNIR